MAKVQRPTHPNEWLTRLLKEDEKDREFAKVLSLPDDAPFWEEWTQEQYEQWEAEHQQPEPPEPENE